MNIYTIFIDYLEATKHCTASNYAWNVDQNSNNVSWALLLVLPHQAVCISVFARAFMLVSGHEYMRLYPTLVHIMASCCTSDW